MSRNLSRPPSSASFRKSAEYGDFNKSFNNSGSWCSEVGRPKTPLSARARMGSDSARATPVPRPHSAMGSARGGDSGGGGVKVVVRTRPANQFELKEDGNKVCFTVATEETCMLQVVGKNDPYTFTFDNVFGQHSRQIEVFEAAGIPTVDNVLSGYNSTIFAYGQTGAGKTHTMVGVIKSEELRGLTPRVFEYLFKKIKEEQATLSPPPEYKVICSNLEIYNETITDLLTPGSTNLQLRNDTKLGSGTYVDGLKEVEVKSAPEALDLMEIGTNSRTVSATNANLTSSRSHCVFTCVITRKHKQADGGENNRISRLNLVDLAGSERAKVSDGKDAQTLKEGCNINKSLTCLGRVIKELVEAQRKGGKVHVPYRDSKLTALLQESLGGNARTTIIAGVSPMFSASTESLSTLQFVQRAKHIKNKAKANEAIKMDPQALHLEVLKLRSQIEKMKKEGFSTAGIETGPVASEPDPEILEKLESKEQRCSELEVQLMNARIEAENSHIENTKLENELSVLRNLKAELQNNIEDMMGQFTGWQQKITEAEEITKKVFEAERQAIMEDIQTHKKRIEDQEIEKKKRDVKIGELEENMSKVMADLAEMKSSNDDLASKLNVANNDIDQKKMQIDQLNKMIDNQRTELEAKVAHYVDLSKKQRDEASALKSEFEKANVDFEEKLAAKDDDMRRAQANYEAQLKARDARLAESVKQFDEQKQQLLEEHQCIVQDLQENIAELTAERERKIRQHKEDVKEWENKYKASIEDYEIRLEENEKRHCSQSEELEAVIRKKENELRDTASRLNAEIASLQRRLEDEDARFQAENLERDNSMQELLYQQKKETKHQVRSLEETVNKYKALVEDKESTIEYLERKHQDAVQSAEAKLKKEVTKLRHEIVETKAEAEAVSRTSEQQMDALERKLDDTKKKYGDELHYKEQRIQNLEEQLGEKDEFRTYLEDYNCALHRYSQINHTLYSVLEGINNTLAEVDGGSRPSSAASSYISSYEDRNTYDCEISAAFSKVPSSRFGTGADSAFQPFSHSDFTKEPLYNARA